MNVTTIRVRTAGEMAKAVFAHMETADVIIKSAAVSDYAPQKSEAHKIKKGENELILRLQQNEDILKTVGQKKKHQVIVGFAAETKDLAKNAIQKLNDKNLDMIAGNLVGSPHSGFESDTNAVTLFFRDGTTESLPTLEKLEVAHLLLDRIVTKIMSVAAAP